MSSSSRCEPSEAERDARSGQSQVAFLVGLGPIPWTPELCRISLFHELMFQVNRAEIAIMRMPPSWVVEALDVLTGRALDFVHVVPVRLELELEREGREEALGDRVVPAVPLAAHARSDAVAREQRTVVS